MAEETTEQAGIKGRKIIVAMDQSSQSEKAFNDFKDNVLRDGDEVVFVSVIEGHGIISTSENKEATKEDFEKLMEQHHMKGKEIMEKCDRITKTIPSNKTSTILKGGKPGEAICELACSCNADMIVMGSRGMGTFRRTFLGSVSDYVLHHAHIPVMVVPKH